MMMIVIATMTAMITPMKPHPTHRSHKEEVTAVLASEAGLVDEIEFDLRRFEKEEQDKRAARVSKRPATNHEQTKTVKSIASPLYPFLEMFHVCSLYPTLPFPRSRLLTYIRPAPLYPFLENARVYSLCPTSPFPQDRSRVFAIPPLPFPHHRTYPGLL